MPVGIFFFSSSFRAGAGVTSQIAFPASFTLSPGLPSSLHRLISIPPLPPSFSHHNSVPASPTGRVLPKLEASLVGEPLGRRSRNPRNSSRVSQRKRIPSIKMCYLCSKRGRLCDITKAAWSSAGLFAGRWVSVRPRNSRAVTWMRTRDSTMLHRHRGE